MIYETEITYGAQLASLIDLRCSSCPSTFAFGIQVHQLVNWKVLNKQVFEKGKKERKKKKEQMKGV